MIRRFIWWAIGGLIKEMALHELVRASEKMRANGYVPERLTLGAATGDR